MSNTTYFYVSDIFIQIDPPFCDTTLCKTSCKLSAAILGHGILRKLHLGHTHTPMNMKQAFALQNGYFDSDNPSGRLAFKIVNIKRKFYRNGNVKLEFISNESWKSN